MSKYSVQIENEKWRMRRENHEKSLCMNQIMLIDTHLKDSQQKLSNLYRKSVLHPKYQNLVAAASISDYLLTQRTYSLAHDGNDKGAYNIYEDDMRVGRIVAAQLYSASEIVNAVKQAGESIRREQLTLYNTVIVESKKIQDSLSAEKYK